MAYDGQTNGIPLRTKPRTGNKLGRVTSFEYIGQAQWIDGSIFSKKCARFLRMCVFFCTFAEKSVFCKK